MPTMTEAARKKLKEFNEAQSDWFAVCPKCHAALLGTPDELKVHKCPTDTRT
jgi:hypothetical protein